MSNVDWSFFQYGCQEVANNARLKAYTQWAATEGLWSGSNCCVEMPNDCYCPFDGLPSEYTDPITDEVCWYDPLIPESAEFLGVYITKVTGLRASTFARSPQENIGSGVTLGRPSTGSRVFQVEALVVATSCCGMDYGLEYLRRTLELGGCGVGKCLEGCGDLGNCGLTCITARVCCPEGEVDNGLRKWVNVGLVDGLAPVEDDTSASCKCCMQRITFTLQSEDRYAFGCEPVVCLDKDADLEDTRIECFDWNSCTLPFAQDECTVDPLCVDPTCILPQPPSVVDNCFCEPMGVSIDCCCVPEFANHRDETFVVTLTAGKNPNDANYSNRGQRNTRLIFYNNDPKKSCPDDQAVVEREWGEADECARLEIPYLKPGATVVFDGRTQRITVECDGQCYPGTGTVYGARGTDPFPLLASCQGIFVCVEYDLANTQFESNPGLGIVPAHTKIERYQVYG